MANLSAFYLQKQTKKKQIPSNVVPRYVGPQHPYTLRFEHICKAIHYIIFSKEVE